VSCHSKYSSTGKTILKIAVYFKRLVALSAEQALVCSVKTLRVIGDLVQLSSRHTLIAANSAAIAICVAVFCYLVLAFPGDDKAGTPSSGSAQIAQSLQQAISKDAATDPQLFGFYAKRAFAPLWWNGEGVTADALRTQRLLAASADHGLPAQRYASMAAPTGHSTGEKAAFDLSLTRAVLSYAADMRDGMLRPKAVFSDVSLPEKSGNSVSEFAAAAEVQQVAPFLARLEPAARDYQLLKAALRRYRSMAGWQTITASKRSPASPPLVANRLAAEGYLAPGASIPAALRLYQVENGLTPTGQLDGETVGMMNVPASERATQIAANMERWRWQPQALEDNHIMVNVADAWLVLVENGAVALRSRVVVGAPDKPTPLMMARANAVTVNPTWHLPKSIIENEIRPKLAEDPDYLARKNMVEEDGEITQLPGPTNALGVLKFELPNPFDVYLHDTPTKRTFHGADRVVSHGCVRVEQIRALASATLGLDAASLEQLIAAGETVRRPLNNSLAIYIQYWSAVPGPDGRTGFREDVYGRDIAMIAAMRSTALRLAKAD
jgi:murein L,D-transpeptidase YcbB/YkuD